MANELQLAASGDFDAMADYQTAIDRLISCSRHSICIFDRDLVGSGYNSVARSEALREFFLGGRARQLRVVVQDTSYIEQQCPRLLLLQRQFSHALSIHRLSIEAPRIHDTLVIGDDSHHVRRFHFDFPRGAWAMNDPARTQPLLRRFDELWGASELAISATTLGL